ncbi:MAG: hypothetical protein WA870_00765, partial [Methylovirgula sp.]
ASAAARLRAATLPPAFTAIPAGLRAALTGALAEDRLARGMEAVRVFFVAVCRFAFFTPPRRDFTGASLVLRDFPVFLTDIRGS